SITTGCHELDRARQAPALGDLGAYGVDHRPGGDQLGQLCGLETGQGDQVVAVGVRGHVQQTEAVGGGHGVGPAAGELVHQVAVHAHDLVRTAKRLGFVVGEPGDLVQ